MFSISCLNFVLIYVLTTTHRIQCFTVPETQQLHVYLEICLIFKVIQFSQTISTIIQKVSREKPLMPIKMNLE